MVVTSFRRRSSVASCALTELAAHDEGLLRRRPREVRGVLVVILRPLAATLKRGDEREGVSWGETQFSDRGSPFVARAALWL